ncbi:MAG: flagellar biosynthetic protein FliR [Phycisphaerales bacterium]
MPVFEQLLPHVPGFVLVFSRLAGLFLFAPVLSGSIVPRQVKLLLTLTLAFVLYPTLDHPGVVPAGLSLADLPAMMATEVLIGLSIGIVATIPLTTVQLAGKLIGQQMGLAVGELFNPAIEIAADNIGQLLYYLAVTAFLMAGGLDITYRALADTFDAVALGGFASANVPLDLLTGVVQSGFEVALRIAMPVMAIIFLENVIVGFIMKTVPALNILSFGFPVRIMAGLFILTSALVAVAQVISLDIEHTLVVIEDWAGHLGPSGEEGGVDG